MPLDGLFTNTAHSAAANAASITTESFRGDDKPFLIVPYGLGRDSTSLILRLSELGIRPDLIIFADLGSEKSATYAYLPIINAFLKSVGFPQVTVIQLKRRRDADFEAHLFRLGIFASFNYHNSHACSATWKVGAIDDYLATCEAVIEAKRQNRKIVRAVGFEMGEQYRIKDTLITGDNSDNDASATTRSRSNASAFAVRPGSEYITWFCLIEWRMDLNAVLGTIRKSGLPIVPKSSCWFCPAMTPEETFDLEKEEPHLFFKGLVLERIAQRNTIVKHDRRVQGLRFGKKWSDYNCAASYLDKIDGVIDFFGLDRSFADGDRRKTSNGWKKKAARVELFRSCFSTADNLRRFMRSELDMSFYAEKLLEINSTDDEPQMALKF